MLRSDNGYLALMEKIDKETKKLNDYARDFQRAARESITINTERCDFNFDFPEDALNYAARADQVTDDELARVVMEPELDPRDDSSEANDPGEQRPEPSRKRKRARGKGKARKIREWKYNRPLEYSAPDDSE